MIDCSEGVFLAVLVSSIDHSSHAKGRFFNFEASAHTFVTVVGNEQGGSRLVWLNHTVITIWVWVSIRRPNQGI